MALQVGTCKLCLQNKPLISQSHIIPEFMYEFLFDKHHKMYMVDPKKYIEGDKTFQRPPSGEYEGGILCAKCDNETIGQYETYGERVLFAGVNKSVSDPICQHGRTETGIPLTRCTNVDYTKFKLFLLSILWRASISKREFFRDVALGPYEEQVRQMILGGDPKETEVFPVIMISWLFDSSMSPEFVAQPGINRATTGIRYVFPIGGTTYVFHVSPESFDKRLLPFTILPTNVITFFHMPEGKGWDMFRRYYNI